MKTRMTVRVSTTDYEFVHGKKPRGTGHWFFYIMEKVAMPELAEIEATFFVTGTYAEATKEAKKIAKNIGASEVKVGA
jgi:hypothetical protein